MIIKISGQNQNGLAHRTFDWGIFANSGLAYIASVVRSASLEVAEAQPLVLQVLFLAQSHL
jgi:hypothetical protein